METNVRKELFTAMYIVKTPQEVHSFDWDFVLPVIEELDELGEKYLLAYSHYVKDERDGKPKNYLRFKLFGTSKVIEHFRKIEAKLLSKLEYGKGQDQFSIESQAKAYGITMEEMMKIFELWDNATRLKIELIKLWLKGGGKSWRDGTHYALNTLGLSQSVKIFFQPMTFTYPEEKYFMDRNFPPKTNKIMNHEEYLRKIRLPESIEKVHQAITEKFPINSKYLFSLDTRLEGDLDKGIIPERMRKELQTKGFPVFEKGIIMKEKDNEWSAITGKNEKMFIVRKEDGKLNIYICFDAWYTNRQYVFQSLAELGQSTAKKLREDLISWHKDIPQELWKLLELENTAPKNWENAPDGALAGITTILAGWIAHQAAGKTRDNPQDPAKTLFEKHVRPLINASMELGIKMAESERKT